MGGVVRSHAVPACCAHTIVCHDSYTPLYINSTIHASLLAAVGAYKLVRQYITGSTRPAIADGDVTPTTPSSGAASAASALTPTTPTRKPWLSSVASYLDKHVTCRNVLLVSLGCTSTASPPPPLPPRSCGATGHGRDGLCRYHSACLRARRHLPTTRAGCIVSTPHPVFVMPWCCVDRCGGPSRDDRLLQRLLVDPTRVDGVQE